MPRLPVFFFGHGSPMNAIEDNPWSRALRALAPEMPRPKAILCVSAHWYVAGTFLTSNERPETIHDFGGFPEPLYAMQYPAPGDPVLARRVRDLLSDAHAELRDDWGLDHGTWTVLHWLYPKADVPVVQLSIDGRAGAARHLALGRMLAPLRDEDVLVVGSGNMTHNLGEAFGAMRSGDTRTPEWAARFDREVASALEAHDADALVKIVETREGRQAHPTPDHYLPLLYCVGAAEKEPVRFPVTGFDLGSLSMRSVAFG